MIPTPLLLRCGDLLDMRGDADRSMWRVEYRRGGGYETSPLTEGKPRFWTDLELDAALGERRLQIVKYDAGGLGSKVKNVLEKTWEYWPQEVRREALRRLEFVRRVDAVMPYERMRTGDAAQRAKRRQRCEDAAARLMSGMEREASLDAAFTRASSEVWAEFKAQWEAEERDAHHIVLADYAKVRKIRPGEPPSLKLPRKPSRQAVRAWWVAYDNAGGELRALISRNHDKGNRTPRFPQKTAEGMTTYRLIALAIDEYMDFKRPNAHAVWKKNYVPLCHEHGLPIASYKTFNLVRRALHSSFDELKARFGYRAAKQRYSVYQRTTPPERPLEEVEVDHWLIDLVVRHPITKRKLGRPWMTLLIDRATRAILGCHLSFEVPSYASLQRALAHSFWRKDVSGIEGIENEWPMHGVPFWIFTDNGREFRSASLRLAEAMLDFGVVNLPAKQPMLKGMVESIFSTMGGQVLAWEDGCTLARSEEYDPDVEAVHSLEDVHRLLLKWIVDDYHTRPHPALKKQSPLQAWIEKTNLYPVPPVPSFEHIIRMTGEEVRRKISKYGVEYEGFRFVSPSHDPGLLERLRVNGGLNRDWVIRVDSYNYGEVWILDDMNGEWLTLENADPEISVGVSRFMHKLIVKRAKELAAARSCNVTTRELLDARLELEAGAAKVIAAGQTKGNTARAARWHTQGMLFSPLYGNGLPSIYDPPQALAQAQEILAKHAPSASAPSSDEVQPPADNAGPRPATALATAPLMPAPDLGSGEDAVRAEAELGEADDMSPVNAELDVMIEDW